MPRDDVAGGVTERSEPAESERDDEEDDLDAEAELDDPPEEPPGPLETSGTVASALRPEDDEAAEVLAGADDAAEADGELSPGADGLLVAPPFATALAAAASAALRPADVPLLEDNPEPDDAGSLDPDPLEPAEAEPEPFRAAVPDADVVAAFDDDVPDEDPVDDAPLGLGFFAPAGVLPAAFAPLVPESAGFVDPADFAPESEPEDDEEDPAGFAASALAWSADWASTLSFTVGPASVTVGVDELPGRDEEPLPAVPSDGLTCHLR